MPGTRPRTVGRLSVRRAELRAPHRERASALRWEGVAWTSGDGDHPFPWRTTLSPIPAATLWSSRRTATRRPSTIGDRRRRHRRWRGHRLERGPPPGPGRSRAHRGRRRRQGQHRARHRRLPGPVRHRDQRPALAPLAGEAPAFEAETGVDPGYTPAGYLFLTETEAQRARLRSAMAIQRAAGAIPPQARWSATRCCGGIRGSLRRDCRERSSRRSTASSGPWRSVAATDGPPAPGAWWSWRPRRRPSAPRVGASSRFGPAEATLLWPGGERRRRVGGPAGRAGRSGDPGRPAAASGGGHRPDRRHPRRSADDHLPRRVPLPGARRAGAPPPAEPAGSRSLRRLRWMPPGWKQVVASAHRRVPALRSVRVASSYAGLYEMSPDEHALLGPSPDLANFFLVNGSSGHGVMHSPALGQLAAEMLPGDSARPGRPCPAAGSLPRGPAESRPAPALSGQPGPCTPSPGSGIGPGRDQGGCRPGTLSGSGFPGGMRRDHERLRRLHHRTARPPRRTRRRNHRCRGAGGALPHRRAARRPRHLGGDGSGPGRSVQRGPARGRPSPTPPLGARLTRWRWRSVPPTEPPMPGSRSSSPSFARR